MLGLGNKLTKNQYSFVGLLDKLGNAENAVFIFSPYKRLLSSFTGDLVKVQRTSDYSSKWFGFDGNGDLQSSELLTWVGAGNDGLVEEVANQANTNNTIQTTIANKPKIVISGTFLSDGILFDGTNDTMYCDHDGLENFKSSLTLYCRLTNLTNGNRRIFNKNMSGGNYSYSFSGRTDYFWEAIRTNVNGYIGIDNSLPNVIGSECRLMCNYNGDIEERWLNDTKYPSVNGTSEILYDNGYPLQIGAKENDEYFNGNIKNIIIFNKVISKMLNI